MLRRITCSLQGLYQASIDTNLIASQVTRLITGIEGSHGAKFFRLTVAASWNLSDGIGFGLFDRNRLFRGHILIQPAHSIGIDPARQQQVNRDALSCHLAGQGFAIRGQ